MWQWFNYVSSAVPPTKQVLRLNLDETPVGLFQGDGKGNIFASKKRKLLQHASRRQRRRYLTHVAVICDQSEIQPLLPQIIIGNRTTFPLRRMRALRAQCPANVFLVRQKSAWNNNIVCAGIVNRIALALAPFVHRFQPVLLMDACKIHFSQRVLRNCARNGIWVIIIPPLDTWLLQPLDTGCFALYKACLQDEYQNARSQSTDAELTMEQFLVCVCGVIRRVLQGRSWASAFDDDGFGAQQTCVSHRIIDHLHALTATDISSIRPSLAEIELCFPRRTAVPMQLLMQPFDEPQRAARPHVAVVPRYESSLGPTRGPRGAPLLPHRARLQMS